MLIDSCRVNFSLQSSLISGQIVRTKYKRRLGNLSRPSLSLDQKFAGDSLHESINWDTVQCEYPSYLDGKIVDVLESRKCEYKSVRNTLFYEMFGTFLWNCKEIDYEGEREGEKKERNQPFRSCSGR